MLKEAACYARIALGLRELIKAPRGGDPDAQRRFNLENRESNFLSLVREVVYSNPHHPYRLMLEQAGCAYADVEQSVQRDGREPTLKKLLRGRL